MSDLYHAIDLIRSVRDHTLNRPREAIDVGLARTNLWEALEALAKVREAPAANEKAAPHPEGGHPAGIEASPVTRRKPGRPRKSET